MSKGSADANRDELWWPLDAHGVCSRGADSGEGYRGSYQQVTQEKKIEAPSRGSTKEGEAINFKNNEGTSYSSM